MRQWNYWANGVWKSAFISIEDGPCYVFLVRRIVECMCDGLHRIPLIQKTLIPHYFHQYVHRFLDQFGTRIVFIDVDYDELKSKLSMIDREFWNEREYSSSVTKKDKEEL